MTDDTFAIELGARIRELRKIKGVSQLELAYDMDMSMNTISGIELGKISPKIETLNKIATKLEIDIGDLFDFSVQPSKDKLVRKKVEEISRKLMTHNKEFIDVVEDSIDNLISVYQLGKDNAKNKRLSNHRI
ncbi:MAG: helix-turn-helix transcriptional regulator [Alphaproteobacteria bacterium]|nr:helix-turn-helix transcriptional regulator [Alphaproteobacteria bacterium]